MAWYLVKRLFWVIPALFAISVVTFLLLELAPSNQAIEALEGEGQMVAAAEARDRAQRLHRLERQYGLRDPETGARYTVWQRYWRWLERAVRFEFAPTARAGMTLKDRLLAALPVTVLLNVLALILALAVAVPLACRAGMRAGSWLDRGLGVATSLLHGIPEFVLATLLLLLFAGGYFDLLPSHGLRSPGSESLGGWARLLDLLRHLLLPVLVLAVGYGVLLFRFLRESVARAAGSEVTRALRGFGLEESRVRQRVVRHGLVPMVTLVGTLLPSLFAGTIIVESVFSLPGLGRLSLEAVRLRDYGTVMALTMLVSLATLIGLIVSDLLHRFLDPRVELR